MDRNAILTKYQGPEKMYLPVENPDSSLNGECEGDGDRPSQSKSPELPIVELHQSMKHEFGDSGLHRQHGKLEEASDVDMGLMMAENIRPKASNSYSPAVENHCKEMLSLDSGDDPVSQELSAKQHEKKCSCCNKCLSSLFRPCQRSSRPIPDLQTFRGRLLNTILCPPMGDCANGLVIVLSVILLWAVLWSITGDVALPGGHLFALLLLEVFCVVGGYVAAVFNLPPLLGMLVVGFMLRNVPYIDLATDLKADWSSSIRNIALAVILIRAGLGLDPAALRRLSVVCLRLAFLPCLAECVTVACVCYVLLDFPWLWGFILGFVLAAVSPAVVVPSMLSLQERGLGIAKGIPTLVIAASSVDDVLAIGGFGVVISITFSSGDLIMTILQGPIEVLIGLIYGGLVGIILWYLPEKESKNATELRFLFLFGAGLFALFGSRPAGFAGAGALGCLCVAFVAAHRWRNDDPHLLDTVSGYFAVLWVIFQPLLFGLIGSEITVDNLNGNTVGLGIVTLCCGLVIRIIVSALAVLGAGFNLKERIFISLAWLPKATVQAAIGPVALDYARANKAGVQAEEYGVQVLTLAVLGILITAPLGAAAISLSGPKLLSVEDVEAVETETKEDPNSVQTHL